MVIKAVEQYKNKREFCKTHRFSENAIYTNWVNENARGNIHLKDLKKLAKLSGTPLEKISKRIKGVSLYKGHKIRLPIYVNKKLMYFAGLIAGDGDLSGDKNRISIRFSNNSDLLIKKFIKLSNDLFGTKCNCSSKGNENRPPSFRFGSNIVFEILSSLGVPKSPKSNKIDLTNNILDLPNDVVAYYIKALFDCDGSVIKRNTKGSSYIDLTTTSQILAKKMQLLLLRYGIIAKIRQRMPIKGKINSKYKKYILEIRGKDNLISFKDKIGFESYEKKKKLDTIINRLTSSNTNVDIIPGINKIIKKLRKSYTISPRVVLKSGTSSLENEYYNMSRPQLKKILNNMQKAKSDIKDNENYQTLQKLQKSDIFWDEIKDIQNITNHKYKHVYDLTVNNSHNFLVNGILVHNTAAVVKDEFLAGWSLEAGAMVLANKGILMIDEMDKMTPEDRSAMHEGLEQQSVSISKANIQATLRCETTVLAAANPKFGRFDPYETIAKQIDLPPALINRFDLIFTIKDIPDEVKDERLAKFILTLHKEKMAEKAPVDTDLLRKYLSYAKQNIFPTLTDTALEELKDYYVKMRTSGSSEEKGMRAIPISPRQLEALIRLSEAAAKVRLSDKITKKDARRAIAMIHYCLEQVGLDPETGKIDIDRISTGITTSERTKIVKVRDLINQLEQKVGKVIPIDDIITAAKEDGIDEDKVIESIEKLKRSGDLFEPKRGSISKI